MRVPRSTANKLKPVPFFFLNVTSIDYGAVLIRGLAHSSVFCLFIYFSFVISDKTIYISIEQSRVL